MATTTPNYGLHQPDVGGSAATWGNDSIGWNKNAAIIDTELKRVDDVAAAAMPKAGGSLTGSITGGAASKVGTAALPILDAHFIQLFVHAAGGANLASIDSAGVVTGTDLVATSDARLKENITPVLARNCLNAITYLQPVQFVWKDGKREAMGLIAQDVKDALPLAVNDTGGYLSLSQPALIAALVGAVIELTRRIEQLESR